MLKHIGRLKHNQRKVIVAYKTLPGDPEHCVCVTTESLEAADHDFVMQLVESNSGQATDEFAEAFVEQLATFALRRVMTIDDRSQIKAIAEKSKKTDYKLRALLENFILSDLFRKR